MLAERRWKLFGHVLRLPSLSPPQTSMEQYYIRAKTCRVTPKITLPVLLNLELLEHTLIKVTAPEDLRWLRTMAADRTGWKNFTKVIIDGVKENLI